MNIYFKYVVCIYRITVFTTSGYIIGTIDKNSKCLKKKFIFKTKAINKALNNKEELLTFE